MIPSTIAPYLSYAGLLLILIGLIFAMVAGTDYRPKASGGDMLSATKYSVLSYSMIVAGGFILLSSR